jgi:hypothetical protein
VAVPEAKEPTRTRGPRAIKTPVDELRKRRSRLRQRLALLQEKLAAARAKESELKAAVDGMKSDLVDGDCDGEGLVDLAQKLEAQKTVVMVLGEALAKVDSEAGAIGEQVEKIEHERERRRQEEASEPLRAEAADLIDHFAAGIANLCAPLKRRREIDARLREEFPLTHGVGAVKFEELARAVDRAMGQPGFYAVRGWLLQVINGPLVGSGYGRLSAEKAGELAITG